MEKVEDWCGGKVEDCKDSKYGGAALKRTLVLFTSLLVLCEVFVC